MASELIVQNLKGPASGSNANKVIVPSGHELTAEGHVIQCRHYEVGGQVSDVNTNAFTVIESVTFTPKFANSHILIRFVNHIYVQSYSADDWRVGNIRLRRGTTFIGGDSTTHYGEGFFLQNNLDRYMTYSAREFIDTSHNTTSQITYNIEGASRNGNISVRFNHPDYGDQCRVTIMEIAQ